MCLPLNSSRQIDTQKKNTIVSTDIYEYQNNGRIFIRGVFNSRCGDMVDFVEGINDLNHRDIVDLSVNKYGHLLIEFLLNSNVCILNGRNSNLNGFTCITSVGR